jgi:uncharacterized protein with beta-barrel porin domain
VGGDRVGELGSVGVLNVTAPSETGTTLASDASELNLNANGFLNLGGALNIINPDGSVTAAPTISNATGTLNQNGALSQVNITGSASGPATFTVGQWNGATGYYNLTDGTLTVNSYGRFAVGGPAGSTGTFNQTGGTVTTEAPHNGNYYIEIGASGTGTYNLSGQASEANFGGGFYVARSLGSVGTVNQTDGTLTAGGMVYIGGNTGSAGTGTYTMTQTPYTNSAGVLETPNTSANFNGGLTVGQTGTFDQQGGTVTVGNSSSVQTLTINGTYNMGGTLYVGNLTGSGTLNFTGGTLTAGAQPLDDNFSSYISKTTTIDTSNAPVEVYGSLSGPGGLNITGSNANGVYFGAANTYQGGTTIGETAFVSADVANLPAGRPVTLTSSEALLDLSDTAAAAVFTGVISGTGNLDTSPFALELTQPTNIGGVTYLSGPLQIFSGSFGTSGNASTGITGTGPVEIGGDTSVATSGTVNYLGTASYTGSTTVYPNFTLEMHGLGGALTNNGTIESNATTPGTITINGAFTQGATGTFIVRANPFAHDQYNVASAVANGYVYALATGTGTYDILDAGSGTLTDNLTLEQPASLVVSTLQQVGTHVNLVSVQGTTTPFAKTPNQLAVAKAIDPFVLSPTPSFIPLLTGLDGINVSQIPQALLEISPESLQYMSSITLENSTFMTQQVDGHLANLRNGYSGVDTSGLSMITPGFESSLGRSLLAYYAPAPNGVNYYPENAEDEVGHPGAPPQKTISDSPDPLAAPASAPPAGSPRPSRVSEFISGNVILANLGQNQGSQNSAFSKATYTAGNAAAGISFRISPHLAAGVLFDYNHTDAKTDSVGSKTRVDSYSPGLFGTFFDKGFYANGLFSFGYNSYSNNRALNFGGFSSTAHSSPTGTQYLLSGDVGYDFQPDRHWILGPTLGVQYTHIDVNSFTESGAGPADLSVNSTSLDSLRSRLGGQLTYQIHSGSILFQPHLTAQWQHEFLDTTYGVSSQLDLPGAAPFGFKGAALGRDSALLGFGLTATLDNSMSAYVDYLAELSSYDYFIQSVQGGIKAAF